MPQASAAVIDLSEYRRRRQPPREAPMPPRTQVVWVPTAWGYWVPVWSVR